MREKGVIERVYKKEKRKKKESRKREKRKGMVDIYHLHR